jgi:quercetin dioxygenase-like cupin family protein
MKEKMEVDMIVTDGKKINFNMMQSDEVKGAGMKKLIGEAEGWDSHVMREVNLEPFGYSPKHAHDWPHINYVLQGHGVIHIDGVDHEVEPGFVAYIPANSLHQFVNKTEEEMRFICIVPKKGHL